MPAAIDARFFVVVKSSNYSQKADGGVDVPQLSLLFRGLSRFRCSAAWRVDLAVFRSAEDLINRETAPYTSREAISPIWPAFDAAYPNGTYRVSIDDSRTLIGNTDPSICAATAGSRPFPSPFTLRIGQGGTTVAPTAIDASQAATIRWNRFSNWTLRPAWYRRRHDLRGDSGLSWPECVSYGSALRREISSL